MGTIYSGTYKTLSGVKTISNVAPVVSNPPVFTDTLYAGNLIAEYFRNTPVSLQVHATDAVSFSITAGALPAGLTMSSTGLITGTAPNVANTTRYNFTVTATNTIGSTVQAMAIDIIKP